MRKLLPVLLLLMVAVMAMAQSDELVDEDEIAARLRYVGLPFHNVRELVCFHLRKDC